MVINMGDDFFGGMFDFDGNGATDIGEAWEAYNIYEECTDGDDEYSPHVSRTSRNTRSAEITHKEGSEEERESDSGFASFIAFIFIPSLIVAAFIAKDSNIDFGTAFAGVLFIVAVILFFS